MEIFKLLHYLLFVLFFLNLLFNTSANKLDGRIERISWIIYTNHVTIYKEDLELVTFRANYFEPTIKPKINLNTKCIDEEDPHLNCGVLAALHRKENNN